eukprot:669711-Pyramimonas_sp.AAC.1
MEWRRLALQPQFRGWSLAILGDANLHFADLAPASERYEGPLERHVRELLRATEGFDAVVRNPRATPTHASGTAIDWVATSQDLQAAVEVIPPGAPGVPADHALLLARLPGQMRVDEAPNIGRARWRGDADWAGALAGAAASLAFIAGWAAVASRGPTIRAWLAAGQWRGARQA